MIFSKLSPAVPSVVFDTYWRFAAERQEIFFKRMHDQEPPWTSDPVLMKYKFTNAYRASDRVSQYLIRRVIYDGDQSPEEVFFRTILFKIFNRIETWQLLMSNFGSVSYKEYSFKHYNAVLTRSISRGSPIYSAAYIMSSGKDSFGYVRKHTNHLKVIEKMMQDDVPSRVSNARTMMDVFILLRSYPTMGDFLGYQFSTDINYSELTDFSEMEFVVPGPGALDGIRKCFRDCGGLPPVDIVKLMADRQEFEFERLGLKFQSLWGRRLQLIDCQNLFCEVDKYSRIVHPHIDGLSGRKKIKQKYSARGGRIEYWYPPKWKINHLIRKQDKRSVLVDRQR
jgi:hypothetical protein